MFSEKNLFGVQNVHFVAYINSDATFQMIIFTDDKTAMQSQNAVSAYLWRKQILVYLTLHGRIVKIACKPQYCLAERFPRWAGALV